MVVEELHGGEGLLVFIPGDIGFFSKILYGLQNAFCVIFQQRPESDEGKNVVKCGIEFDKEICLSIDSEGGGGKGCIQCGVKAFEGERRDGVIDEGEEGDTVGEMDDETAGLSSSMILI